MRGITIHTGAGGYDLLEEMMLEESGYKRIYLGRKLPRFLKNVTAKARVSANGRYFVNKKIAP